jgi:hypothetical protein
MSPVMRAFSSSSMKPSVSRTFSSGKTLRKGDSSSLTATACVRAPSKTSSPVVFTKSVRTM